MGKRYHFMLLGLAVAVFVVSGLAAAGASSANISHSYQAGAGIQNGSIVSLDPQRSGYVQPSDIDNGDRLLGVAVAVDDSLLAIGADAGKVQVATSGSAPTLVSTLSGDIEVGDQIAVSPFAGIGMKALPGSRVIGLAQVSFNGKSPEAIKRQVTDRQGRASTIMVGYVPISIDITTAPSDTDLNGLQKLARSLTGHKVSTLRVVISLGVALIAIIALVTLTYSSIYGSIIATGRNPLAREAIFRTLLSVIGLAALTALLGGLTIFFLLK